jgi:choline dehydrogenase
VHHRIRARGSGGPVTVEDLPSPTSLLDILLTGFTEAGYGPRGDSNGATPFVADRYQPTFAARTRRTPADGTRAVGVRYEKDGTEHQLVIQREFILSAGVINTPQLLMVSGVGPAAHFREHAIELVADVPGVGENLHDPCIAIQAVAPERVGGSYRVLSATSRGGFVLSASTIR